MNRHQEIIQELQPKIATYQSQLTDMFEELLKEARADQGFLAFENVNGKLGIIANKGDYWHLSTDQGATGEAVKSSRPSITDPKSAVFKETGTNPSSELIYPIEFSEEVVGAILLDKFKGEKFEDKTHYSMVARYVTRISEVLADANPWNFRAWWQEQQRSKRNELFERAQRCVEATLAANVSDLEGRVESITREGTLVLEGPIIGRSGTSRPGDQETVAAALRTGEKAQRPAGVTRHECHIPFPLEGPVQGIVTLVAEKEGDLSANVIEDLERRLQELDYQHFAPALNSTRQGAEHYFSLVLLALTSPPSLEVAHQTLESIAARAEALCADKVQILYVPDSEDVQYSSAHLGVATLDQILARLDEPGTIKRPHCLTREGWLRCPVLVRGNIRGLVQVKSDPHGISNIYNSDIVVVVALLVAELLARLPSASL
jgi:hypothetical protein